MKDSRLIEIFSALTKKERAEITKAVRSPFFNQREDLAALWDLLCASKEIPSKEAAFAKIYSTETYQAQQMYLLMSWLLALTERVLLVVQNEENEIDNTLTMSILYRKKGLEKPFQSSIAATKTLQQKAGFEDVEYFQQAYQLELEHYEFNAANRTAEQNLQSLSDTLDISYMLEKLRQSCFLLAHQTVYKTTYNTGLLNVILQHIESNIVLLETPSVAVYYYCYRALQNPSETAHFQIFRQLLIAHFNLFRADYIRDLYLLAVNYCIKKHNALGDDTYAHQGLELYKTALREGFLLENGVLSRFSFKNIVAWALLAEEYDWTESFINDYRNRLERTYRDSMYSFSLARLEYSRRNYEAALLLLQKAEYRDTLLALAAKTILMKIYYETNEYNALEAHLGSMRTYLSRKRVLGYHKTNYQNVINYTQKLTTIGDDKLKINALREAIEGENILTEKEWLLAQL